MFGQEIAGRGFVRFCRGDDVTAGEGQEQTGEVGIDADGTGGDDGVVVGNAEHPLVKAPVAEPYDHRYALCGIRIVTPTATDYPDLINQNDSNLSLRWCDPCNGCINYSI